MSKDNERSDDRVLSESEVTDEAFLLEKGVNTDAWGRTKSQSLWSRHRFKAAWLAALCATNLLTFYITHPTRPQCPWSESVAEPPKLTPMLRDLHLETRHVKFDSTFFSQGSRYRGPPSPEVDAAWEYAGANCKQNLQHPQTHLPTNTGSWLPSDS